MVSNEVIRTILHRKGVKKYKQTPIPRELLETIVTAGAAAPNAFNRQAWLFTVVTTPEILTDIDTNTNMRLEEEPGYHALYGAPALINSFILLKTIPLPSRTALPPIKTGYCCCFAGHCLPVFGCSQLVLTI